MRGAMVFLFAALTGCASGPRYGESGIGPSDNPVLYIARAPGFYGMKITPVVFVNGILIGNLPAGAYFVCTVQPGVVRIGTSITSGKPAPGALSPSGSKDITRLSFTTEPGRDYIVQWRSGPEAVLVPQGAESKSIRFARRQPNGC